jgi:hypothetical protein
MLGPEGAPAWQHAGATRRGSPLATRCSRAIASFGEQRFLAAGQRQVMAEVGGGLGEVHRLDREPGGDPLAGGGERAHPQLPVEGGLAGQDPGERGGRVHLGVRQEP